MSRTRFFVALVACLAVAIVSGAVTATAPVLSPQEAQGWRTENDHIHTTFSAPMLARLDAPLVVPVTTLLHNRVGGNVTFVRWSEESTVLQVVNMKVPGDGTSEQRIVTNLTVDPAKFSRSGWREVRVTSNYVDPAGKREFTTTRTCVFVVNGKSRSDYCNKGEPGVAPTDAGRCGAGAWYQATEYSIILVDCRDVWSALTRPLKAGDVVRVKAQAGRLYVNLDPAFHAGLSGTPLVVDQPSGTTFSVKIPAGLAPGPHKLHMRDQRSNGEAGVYVLPFTIG